MQTDTVHGLIQIALTSCKEADRPAGPEQTSSMSEEREYARDAVMALYNLAHFDRPKYYIPGETVRQAKDRRKFFLWGGMLLLQHLSTNTKVKEVAEFCDSMNLKELELRDHEDEVKVLKLYVEAGGGTTRGPNSRNEIMAVSSQTQKPAEEERECDVVVALPTVDETGTGAKVISLDSSSPQDVFFPEYERFDNTFNSGLKTLNIPEILAVLEEELQMKKEELNKKLMEMQQQRLTQKEEEAKRREEEERQRKEKKEQAFQEYIRRIEQRKKERADQMRKEQEEKENRLKEEEAKKKSLIEMLKKKEEDRRIKRYQEMKKKAELEKKEAEELERRNREHMERQQKALEEWHKRKIESAKKVRSSITDKYLIVFDATENMFV